MKKRILTALLALTLLLASVSCGLSEDFPDGEDLIEEAVVESHSAQDQEVDEPEEESEPEETEPEETEPEETEPEETEPEETEPEETEPEETEPEDVEEERLPVLEPQENAGECTHEKTHTWYNPNNPNLKFIALGDGTHRVTGPGAIWHVCNKCNAVVRYTNSLVEPCEFDENGKCLWCDPENGGEEGGEEEVEEGHVHTLTVGPTYIKGDYVETVLDEDNPEDYHVARYQKVEYYECECGQYGEGTPVEGEYIDEIEAHQWVDGRCADDDCGYVCEHGDIAYDEKTEHEGEPYYDYDGADGHYVITPILADGICQRCGAKVKGAEVDFELGELEPHRFRKGVCRLCDYECEHDDEVEELSKPYYEYYEADREDHLVVRVQRYRVVCDLCGEVLYQDTEELSSFYEAHDFDHGECTLCGYEKHRHDDDDDDEDDDDEDDEDEEEDDEDEDDWDGYVDLLSDDRLNGVAVIDGLTLIETAKRVGDSMQHDVDAGFVSMVVVNLDKLLTADEMAAVKQLPVRDQLILALNYVGYRDSVNRAMESDPYLITGAARALIDTIDQRINAMNDSERKSMSNAIRRYFPMAEFQIRDGVTTEVFNLDLKITEDNSVTFERYAFHQAGSEWTLINIATKAG